MVFCKFYELILMIFGMEGMSLSYLTLLLEECLQHMFEKLQFDAQ